MKRIYYVMLALLFCAVSINAQVRIGNNTEPHKGAVLDLQSTETVGKGLLLPQVELTSLTVFSPVAGTATEGMLVYNIGNAVDKGLYVWDGSSWSKVSGGSGNNGGDSTPTACGAWLDVGKTQWLTFMCHNLGADETANPFTPAATIHGAKYIWGSNTAILSQYEDQANAYKPSGWTTPSANADGSWIDEEKTINDPCPNGWRVPTSAQWESVIASNTTSYVGIWTNSSDNYFSGVDIGGHLFLPTAGLRYTAGMQGGRGYEGYYWSSTGYTNHAYNLFFLANPSGEKHIIIGSNLRDKGLSVRCVADN